MDERVSPRVDFLFALPDSGRFGDRADTPDSCFPMNSNFFSRKTPVFGTRAVLILCIVFFLAPFALRGARLAVDRMENNIVDWLPEDFPETKDLKWEMTDFSWGGQHDCQMLANGNIILFANGSATYEGQPHSRIIEIDPATREQVWTYKSNPGSQFYSHHISGQERLASGNTLICEGLWGRVFEVTPDGEIVWEFISPHMGKTFFGDDVNWVFRAFRYDKDSPELAGRVG